MFEGRGWSTKGGRADLRQQESKETVPKDFHGNTMKWVPGHGWEPKDSSYPGSQPGLKR